MVRRLEHLSSEERQSAGVVQPEKQKPPGRPYQYVKGLVKKTGFTRDRTRDNSFKPEEIEIVHKEDIVNMSLNIVNMRVVRSWMSHP